MSDCLTPALYKGRALDLQWMNNIYNSHDLFCGCQNPINHLNEILKRDKQQKCLPSTTAGDTADHGENTADYALEEGDLDALFEQPFTEDEG